MFVVIAVINNIYSFYVKFDSNYDVSGLKYCKYIIVKVSK